MRHHLLLILGLGLGVAACGGAQPQAPSNVAPPAGLTIPPTQPLGWLGLAPAPAGESELPSYLPVHATFPLIVTPALMDLQAPQLSAIGTSGKLTTYQPAVTTQIPFGCDNNELEVTPFIGKRLPPGVAWILPPGAPSTWKPEALPVRVVASAPEQARFTVGALGLELARATDTTGTLSITHAGRTIYTQPFERSLMDGAPPEASVLDLRERDLPGIPSPVGAWSIVPGGPILLALHTPGWEGSSLSALIVEDERARTADALTTYLYRCAF